ncbi:sporulation protein YjcZ [Cohnella pontilimi]|uniref:Sporulation protein YjcZ n=1 Tax=Cohnella pontilimi TaxID=2564100 RepID=A0A4U0F951_9BACL|nr:sporulation protein YjcZ [Cohnella pontilimi]
MGFGVGGFSCAGFGLGRWAAFVLVLFILLVIVLSAGLFI